jgi:D-beta-D-heptose 7-phosphate kinase/D-beta-D-heptose 1-phosphate adenosyltransferase
LHPGHIGYLNQAKKLGDRLIVAVNTDESVMRLNKGIGRPFNSLDARMEVLSGLRAVDWVVSFAEDTPAQIISQIMPDILVKGGDYLEHQVVGHDIVQQQGGKVIILPFRVGYSTTRLVEKVRGD